MAKDTPEDDETVDTMSEADSTGQAVPPDTEWELVVQTPFEVAKSDGLTTTIVYAVAEAEGIAPRDLKHPPLFDVVDISALEAAFFGNHDGDRVHDPNSSTEFMYRDYRVVVKSDGWVHVYERSGE